MQYLDVALTPVQATPELKDAGQAVGNDYVNAGRLDVIQFPLKDRHRYLIIRQLNYCDPGPSLTPVTIPEGLDQRMLCQRLVYCLTQHPRPLAMDNAYRRQASHEGGIKVAVKLGQSLVYCEPP